MFSLNYNLDMHWDFSFNANVPNNAANIILFVNVAFVGIC